MAQRARGVASWIQRRLRTDPPRSKSLIMTVFGDSIAPYAPGIWLSELIQLLAPFGVNERLVRTSGFRLVEEGWLQPERQGRRSQYRLTESGWQRVRHASHRIYDPPPAEWSGRWTVIILRKSENGAAERVQLRRELEWEGFGTLATGIFVHPCADLGTVREVLERLGLLKGVVLLEGATGDTIAPCSAQLLVSDCWRLDAVGARYQTFTSSFTPALAFLREGVDPESAFVVQTLLIHAFRRVVLHDPRLPRPLLPKDWPGHAAYELCREIYKHTYEQTRDLLAEHVEAIQPGRTVPGEVVQRLGGIENGSATRASDRAVNRGRAQRGLLEAT